MAGELGKVHLPTKQLEETLSKLTVPELQQKLKKRGLKKSGVKAKLIQRLAEAIRAEQAEEEDTNDDSLNKDDSSGPLNDASLEESTGFAGSSSNELAPFHDPYTEFESSIPGVVDLQKGETIIESSTKDVDEADHRRQNENLTELTGPAAHGEEHCCTDVPETLASNEVTEGHGLERVLPVDQEPVDQYSEEKDSMVLGSGNVEDVLEGTVDKENRENLNVYSEDAFTMDEKEEDHFTTEHEEPEYQSIVHHENEYQHETMEECQKPEDEVQIEDRTSCNEVDEEISAETVGNNDNTDETMEMKENIDQSDDLEAHRDDHGEDGIEIDLQRGEKDDFLTHEIETEQQSDLSVKHKIKLEKKKLTTPVHLKKRRNITEADSDPKQDTPVPRKRRWGSSRSNESLTISSESLKGLIPEVSVIPTPNEDPLGFGLDYGEMEEGEIDDVVEADTQLQVASESKEADASDVIEEGSFRKEVRRGRIVRISMKDTVKLQRAESNEEEEEEETKTENEKDAEIEVTLPEEKVSLLPEISSEDPDYVRERLPSPPKHEPSRILSIKNLVRPFTVRQLREFLSKAGTIVEDEFWIDRIKSHCYVTYETVDDAVASRSVIHGARWPAANPKLLSADFAINNEMYKETEGKLGVPPSPIRNEEQKPKSDKNEERQRKREIDTEQEKRKHEKEQLRDKEQKAEAPAKPKEKKEAPGKLLDDLFRKTKALPCIYWLPLTKDQVAAKEKEREKRREDRLKLNEEANIRENKEIEENRKQREIQNERREKEREGPRGRSDERIDRKLPVQYRNRRRSKSP